MKTWKCYLLCNNPVSEMGAYVKISSVTYAHLSCYRKAHANEVRDELTADARQKGLDDAERQKEQAIAAWRAAPRCPKCGVPMLSERPAGLPEAFSSVQQGSGQTCYLCVRQEVGLRAAARGREAPPPTRFMGAQVVVDPSLPPGGVAIRPAPKEEERPKDRFELIDVDD